ncbi:alkaline phosphatase family protein [Halorussus salinisoli]|uniref:alkaline phosphatase family protein n=1 Tax=Halorussus salinisoli TaxID=2558242 RepID=UPI0010C219E9|nr:alkaline phosphatase family protein [Halorussus salinisoli]
MNARKTVIFGLDGACFHYLQPWLDEGTLPTIQDLIGRGGCAALESCVPATTPPAWTSLTTGVNPGKHGIFGFYTRQKNTYQTRPVSNADVYARRLWEYASEAGLTSLVLNVPVTHPPREISGTVIPGYIAQDSPETYPADILDQLGLTGYSVYAPSEARDVPSDQLLTEWLELTDSRRELALSSMTAFDWDLLFLQFQKTDGAVHKFTDREKIRRVFERVDASMKTILEAVDGDPNVFVVSDHGIGQEKEWTIALNTVLAQAGYVETTKKQSREETWLEQNIFTSDQTDGASNGLERVLRTLGSVGVTKQQIERLLSTVGMYNLVASYAPAGLGDSLEEETVDHERSTAFYEGMGFSGVDIGVIVNDDRFYSSEVVSAEEYGEVRDEVMHLLETLEGPAGKPFVNVTPREDVYHGSRVEYAPDIILEQAPPYVIGSDQPRGKAFIPTDDGRIDHTRHGLIVAAGPDIRDGWSLEQTPSITDVTPTVLQLLEVPLNSRFDGTVLEPVLRTDAEPSVERYDEYEPNRRSQRTRSEQTKLRERLQGMGYLE